jgi:hypothetical protein
MNQKKMLKTILENINKSNLLNIKDLAGQMDTTKESIDNALNILLSTNYLVKNEINSSNLCNSGCCRCSESTFDSINSKFTLSLTEKGKRLLSA